MTVKNLRLAVVTHNVIKGDGQGRANYEIARACAREGWDVTLFADRVAEDLEAEGIRWVRVQPRVRGNWLAHGLEFVQKVRPLLKAQAANFDVIHGYGYTLDVPHQVNTSQYVHSAWMRSSMHPARTNRNLYGAYQWLYTRLNALGERRAYGLAQTVVAASSTVRGELEGIGIPARKLRVILNGADPREFHPAQNQSADAIAAERVRLGLPTGVTLGLFAGDIRTGRKNLDTVLKSLTQVPEMHLAVVGRKAESPFPHLAEQLAVANRVHFLDFRRDIADIMRVSDLFVFPSRYEACALVLVEAIASGLPVITAHTTGGSEVVTDESGIRIANPDDAAALADAMRTLATNPERRRAMAHAAARSSQNYTWEKITSQYLAVYRDVAGGRAATPTSATAREGAAHASAVR